MENATKALLIAASVLIAILIISLGLVVYNKAAESMDTSIMSDTEIASFNGKFLAYEGTNVSGSKVNALLRTVLQNNMSQTDDGKKVYVYWNTSSDSRDERLIELAEDVTGHYWTDLVCSGTNTILYKVDTGSTYSVECEYFRLTEKTNGMVRRIKVTPN